MEESNHTLLFESQEIPGGQLWRREHFPAYPFLCVSSLCSANGYIRGFEIEKKLEHNASDFVIMLVYWWGQVILGLQTFKQIVTSLYSSGIFNILFKNFTFFR